MSASSGWLSGLTNWIKELVTNLWESFADFMGDFAILVLSNALEMWATIFEFIPVPDFLTNLNICGLLAQAGPTAGWLIGTLQLPAGFALISGAIVFRLLRVFLTLFQWT
ncbi:hypothetical protein [Luteimonas fraxinea]|uniref:hypothetical protein n=1 Tax=Luteimonas fraxinea TaxID=2901869 RepID=UPI001E4414BD|nr:hypothetical protein [Luteimonas fraxinea]MCD9125856.1 hypothetical protein [Luteimonas fraxinea]